MSSIAVNIRLNGILVFSFDKQNRYCQVGVNNRATNHAFELQVFKKTVSGEAGNEEETTLQPVAKLFLDLSTLKQGASFWLKLVSEARWKLTPGSARPDPAAEKQGKHSFDKVLTLEAPEFLKRKLDVKPGALRPAIFITNGLFFTEVLVNEPDPVNRRRSEPNPDSRYFAVEADLVDQVISDVHDDKGDTNVKALASLKGGGVLKELEPYAAVVGASLNIEQGQALILTLGERGPELFRLPWEDSNNVSYLIIIQNDDPGSIAIPDFSTHFLFHYDAVVMQPDEKKIALLTLVPPGATDDKGKEGNCHPTRLSFTGRFP